MKEVTITKENLFNHLKERGFVYQTTDEEEIKKICSDGKASVYVGIDPTADSLHIGHFFSLLMLRKFQQAGHRVIVLLGGATAMIGDPSGRNDMRDMVSKTFVEDNYEKIKATIEKAVNLEGENPAIIVNNADWIRGYDYVDFMRDIGQHFNVAHMLASDSCQSRMKAGGLTFFEMGYMLIQAYDFVRLNRDYGCRLEIGGSDQWGNIIAGVELGRKLNFLEGKNPEAFQGLTSPLLTDANGKKMGKTSKGTLWISKEKTSPYEFYQYFVNVDDRDVLKLLKLFTNYEISELEDLVQKDIISAKKLMAYEVTKLIHGEEDAKEAQTASEALFGGGADFSNAPTIQLSKDELKDGKRLLEVALSAKLIPSISEGRRLVSQNAISLNDNKISDPNYLLSEADFTDGFVLLKKGKKNFVKIDLV
ncbi:MAG: tyrosine--tRNA ligase [Christensenellales bacterium]